MMPIPLSPEKAPWGLVCGEPGQCSHCCRQLVSAGLPQLWPGLCPRLPGPPLGANASTPGKPEGFARSTPEGLTRTSCWGKGPREFSGTLMGGMTQSRFCRRSPPVLWSWGQGSSMSRGAAGASRGVFFPRCCAQAGGDKKRGRLASAWARGAPAGHGVGRPAAAGEAAKMGSSKAPPVPQAAQAGVASQRAETHLQWGGAFSISSTCGAEPT